MNEDVSDPHPNINHADLSLKPSMDADGDQHQKKYLYDVFISFRGEDTRKTITSHLERALKERGIETYIDDRLERGEEISKALLDAIEDSKFSIVIFSTNYATSSWCLDELEHIIQSKKEKMQIVLPVFYNVDPANVRKQKESYADAFVKLEQRFPDTKTRKWRSALTEAANLSGWHISENDNRNDAELVDEIVKHIREKLETLHSPIDYLKKGLVGIDKRIKDLDKLLANASKVGIFGTGGLGKTTLAEVVFERSRHQFDHGCILKDVREQIEKNGSNHLAQDFVKRLSKEENGDFDDAKKKMLSQKKLLLVLDDVDCLEHYEALLKDERDWLNSESKVIITSRDKQLLRNIVRANENIYDLQRLNEEEALQLFLLHAFKRENVEEKEREFSRKFVDYAKGLPIALKVLGSDLYLKSMNEGQSLLSKLKQVEPDQVQKVLRVSFDGLEEKEKSIFLVIACFFRGQDKDFVKDKLGGRGSFDAVIGVLVDKCLITISKSTFAHGLVLQVHDLLHEMGQSIARGLGRNHLQNHSRLLMSKDICHVLKNDKNWRERLKMFIVLAGRLKIK
ncbi:TMV resistance protein N-like [Humulus lupulus]|uniref:TMV resistance protein N-like n=1 Tax=Humulus lupulus TaxID=3486 RepID=UPI002B40E3E5|nr:TMV resistance protein N-like [Humulus lupulus]